MYLHMTVAKVMPEKVWEAIQVLKKQACQPGSPEIQGLCQAIFIESQEEPGRVIWLSAWETLADSQTFLSSPRYADLVAEVRPYLLREPEWYRYSVLEDLTIKQE